jgi:hypothetical protein
MFRLYRRFPFQPLKDPYPYPEAASWLRKGGGRMWAEPRHTSTGTLQDSLALYKRVNNLWSSSTYLDMPAIWRQPWCPRRQCHTWFPSINRSILSELGHTWTCRPYDRQPWCQRHQCHTWFPSPPGTRSSSLLLHTAVIYTNRNREKKGEQISKSYKKGVTE